MINVERCDRSCLPRDCVRAVATALDGDAAQGGGGGGALASGVPARTSDRAVTGAFAGRPVERRVDRKTVLLDPVVAGGGDNRVRWESFAVGVRAGSWPSAGRGVAEVRRHRRR